MDIIIQTKSEDAHTALLMCGGESFPCTLGSAGVTLDKVEGDKKTPIGSYSLRKVFYRADRVSRPDTALDVEELKPDTGWCEDPSHADYNKQVVLPHASNVDKMTRDDDLYDVTVVIGYNDDPPVAGKGSAIFMHHARKDFTGTAGCVGLAPDDLRKVLKMVDKSSRITILPAPRK